MTILQNMPSRTECCDAVLELSIQKRRKKYATGKTQNIRQIYYKDQLVCVI